VVSALGVPPMWWISQLACQTYLFAPIECQKLFLALSNPDPYAPGLSLGYRRRTA